MTTEPADHASPAHPRDQLTQRPLHVVQTGPVDDASAAKQLASEHLASTLLELRGRLIRLVERAGYQRAVAEDAMQDVALKFLTDLENFDPTGMSDDFREWPLVQTRWTPPYLATAVLNAAHKSHAKRRFELVELSDDRAPARLVSTGEAALAPDEVPEVMSRRDRNTAVRLCLNTLVDRGTRMRRGTFISPARFRSYAARREALRLGLDLSAVSVSERIGVPATTLNADVNRIDDTIAQTRYVVGVLGGRGWLLSRDITNRALDTFDHSAAPLKQTLRGAAQSVRHLDGAGTRVDRSIYPRDAVELHDHETNFVDAVQSPEPNCVLICAEHTSDPLRNTEF